MIDEMLGDRRHLAGARRTLYLDFLSRLLFGAIAITGISNPRCSRFGLPLATLRDEQGNLAVVYEPLETTCIRLTKRFNQLVDASPTFRIQQALKDTRVTFPHSMIAVTSSQIERAFTHRFDPRLIVERHILSVANREISYQFAQSCRF